MKSASLIAAINHEQAAANDVERDKMSHAEGCSAPRRSTIRTRSLRKPSPSVMGFRCRISNNDSPSTVFEIARSKAQKDLSSSRGRIAVTLQRSGEIWNFHRKPMFDEIPLHRPRRSFAKLLFQLYVPIYPDFVIIPKGFE
jgi:hypothetical protein